MSHASVWKGKRVLVTGGAGFIGSHLVDHLVTLGGRIQVLDDLSHGWKENVNPEAELVIGSVTESELVAHLVAGSETVFHLAADTRTRESEMGWSDPAHDFDVNAKSTLNVLEGVRQRAPSIPVVLASSAAVYGSATESPTTEDHPTLPVSPYGVSKLASESYGAAYAKEKGLKTVTARVFNTYGPRQRRYVMYDLIMKLMANPDRLVVIGTGEQVRDYTYVSDTVRALVGLAEIADERRGARFNLASGMPVRLLDLAQAIVERVSPGIEIETTGTSWAGDIDVLVGDAKALRTAIGFRHEVDLAVGLDELVAWALANAREEEPL